MTTYIAQRKLMEAGKKYQPGDKVTGVKGDRLVFLLAREFILPVGGWDALDDELFLDVMEARD